MKIVLYLHLHQPWRLARFRYLDLGSGRSYFDLDRNLGIFRGISERCYRPTMERLLRALEEFPEFRLSLSVTGTFVEQARLAAPDEERRVFDRKPFSQVRIVSQRSAAISHGKQRGDKFQVVLLAASVDRLQSPEEVRRLLAERVQTKRDDGAVKVTLTGRVENFGNLGDIAVRLQAPSENPYKPVSKTLGGAEPQREKTNTCEQKTLVHDVMFTGWLPLREAGIARHRKPSRHKYS